MSRQIRAAVHRCVAGLAGAHHGLQDRILLTTQELWMRIKYARKLVLLLCVEIQQTFIFLHPCWGIIKCLIAFMLTTAVFELVQQFYHATEIGDVANAVNACSDQPQQTK